MRPRCARPRSACCASTYGLPPHHLRPAAAPPGLFWPGIDLDLSNTVLVDFDLSGCVVRGAVFDCCSDRLRDFYVFASDTPFTSTDPATTAAQPGVWNARRTEAAGTNVTFPVSRTARYVRVQLVGNDRPLSLAEVQILG